MVRYNPVRLGLADSEGMWWGNWQQTIVGFTTQLPAIVAAHLHVEEVEDAHLTPDDVEVHATQRQVGDVGKYGIDVTVVASYFEERKVDLADRQHRITDGVKLVVKNCFPGVRGLKVAVYVLLAPASFGEFEIN